MIRIFQNLHSRIEFSRGKICINMRKVFSQNLKQHIVSSQTSITLTQLIEHSLVEVWVLFKQFSQWKPQPTFMTKTANK